MQYLKFGDWIVIGIYFVAILWIGLRAGKGQKNARDYFLGGRDISWWAVGFSIVATETSALTFIGVPAISYMGNYQFIQLIFGYIIARILIAVYMTPLYFKGVVYSPYQMLADKYGEGARRVAGFFFLVTGTLAAGVRVYVVCIPIQLALGVNPMTAILIFVGLSLVYTYFGGLKSVIWTDTAQFILLIFGGLFTFFYLPTLIDGGWGTVFQQAALEDKFKWLDFGLRSTTPYTLWMGLFGVTFLVMFTHGVDQLIAQRVLACRNAEESRKALYLSAVFIFPMFLLFLGIGTLLWVYYQNRPFPIEPVVDGEFKPDFIFPIFIFTVLPTWIKGLLAVGLLSAAMSSVSSALSALASVTIMDFYRPWVEKLKVSSGNGNGNGNEQGKDGGAGESGSALETESDLQSTAKQDVKDLAHGRLATLIWGVLLIGVSYSFKDAKFLIATALGISGWTAGALLGGVVLAMTRKKNEHPAPLIIGMALSLAAIIWIQGSTKIAWPWFTPIGLAITLTCALGLHPLFSRRTDSQADRK
jgi:solute:Na+ symporter, SSS family